MLEFMRVIDTYQLPFDLTNAVLLVRSDMALSSVIQNPTRVYERHLTHYFIIINLALCGRELSQGAQVITIHM